MFFPLFCFAIILLSFADDNLDKLQVVTAAANLAGAVVDPLDDTNALKRNLQGFVKALGPMGALAIESYKVFVQNGKSDEIVAIEQMSEAVNKKLDTISGEIHTGFADVMESQYAINYKNKVSLSARGIPFGVLPPTKGMKPSGNIFAELRDMCRIFQPSVLVDNMEQLLEQCVEPLTVAKTIVRSRPTLSKLKPLSSRSYAYSANHLLSAKVEIYDFVSEHSDTEILQILEPALSRDGCFSTGCEWKTVVGIVRHLNGMRQDRAKKCYLQQIALTYNAHRDTYSAFAQTARIDAANILHTASICLPVTLDSDDVLPYKENLVNRLEKILVDVNKWLLQSLEVSFNTTLMLTLTDIAKEAAAVVPKEPEPQYLSHVANAILNEASSMGPAGYNHTVVFAQKDNVRGISCAEHHCKNATFETDSGHMTIVYFRRLSSYKNFPNMTEINAQRSLLSIDYTVPMAKNWTSIVLIGTNFQMRWNFHFEYGLAGDIISDKKTQQFFGPLGARLLQRDLIFV